MRSSARSRILAPLSKRLADRCSDSVLRLARFWPSRRRHASSLSPNLALYEPPFIVNDSRPPVPKDYVAHINDLVAAGRRGDAVEFFMTAAVGVPNDLVAQMRGMPTWANMEKVAHTLVYDGEIMGDNMAGNSLRAEQWAPVTIPTLVIDGGASPAWMHNAAQSLADVLSHAARRTLEGQTHAVDPAILAPVLVEFFGRP